MVVPTTFIPPTKAIAPAAAVSVKPCSRTWGIRWVPIRPLLVKPQTKKLPASSQKSPVRTAA
jgi:hypothetical protein